MKNRENKKGISLIVLVITIIVVIIIAGIVILNFTNRNSINDAKEASFRNDILTMKELRVQTYNNKIIEYEGDKDKIVDSDFSGIVDEKYSDRFHATTEGIVFDGEDPRELEIAIEMGCIIETKLEEPKLKSFDAFADSTKITMTLEVLESKSGMKPYQYLLKEEWQDEFEVIGTSDKKTFETRDVEAKVKYTVKAIIEDKAGNRIETEEKEVMLRARSDIPEIEYQTQGWHQKQEVNIFYDNQLGNKNYYQIDGGEEILADGDEAHFEITKNNTEIIATAQERSGRKKVSTAKITNIDTEKPNQFVPKVTATTNSLLVEGSTTDNGASGIAGYRYSKDNGMSYTEVKTQTSYTFTNLTQDTNYLVKMQAVDKAGNVIETNSISIKTVKIGTPEIKVSTTEWTNQNVKVTITYPNIAGGINEYSTDGKTYKTYAGEMSISSNQTIYARTRDSKNQTGGVAQKVISNIDKSLPTATISPNGGNYVIPTGGTVATIKARLTATDTGGSGLNLVQYAWSTSNTTEPTSWTNFTAGGQDITTTSGVGTKYLWTKVTDKAGNRAENIKVSGAYVITNDTNTTGRIILKPSTTEWTNQNINVSVSYGNTINQNRKAGMQGGTLTANATTVTVSANGVVYAEATDIAGNKVTKTLQITNIDKVNPQAYVETTVTSKAIMSVYATDDASGVAYIQAPNGNKVTAKSRNDIKVLVVENMTSDSTGHRAESSTGYMVNALKKYYSNVVYNNTITYDEIIAGGYDVIVSNGNVWGTLKASLLNQLYKAGKGILTIGNDCSATLEIIQSSVSKTAGYTGQREIENEVTKNMPATILQSSDSLNMIQPHNNAKTWYGYTYEGVKYAGICYMEGEKGGKWLHSQISLNGQINVLEELAQGVDRLAGVNGASQIVEADGTYEFKVADKAGNVIIKPVVVKNIDKEAPQVTIAPNGGKYVVPTGGTVATIKTRISAVDIGASGLHITQYAWSTSNTTEPTSWTNFTAGGQDISTTSGEGNMYLWLKVIDKAGNRANIKVSNAFIVSSNTSSQGLITLTPSTTGWTNQNINVTVGYGANLTQNKKAGMQGGTLTANATSVTVSANGVVYAEATDIAGNKITKTLQITTIDKTLPTATISPNGGKYTVPTSGNTATIKARLTASDSGGSGLNLVQYAWSTSNTTEPTSWTNFTAGGQDISTTSGVGNMYLWTKVTDKAGSRATSIKVSNAYTVTANTASENLITLTPSTTNWTNQNITVTVGYGSNISQNRKAGIQGGTLTANATSVTVTANSVVYAEATDIAGNKITKTLQITKIDKTLPTTTISPNGGKYTIPTSGSNAAIKARLTATDSGGSGLNLVQYAWSTSNTTEPTSWTSFTAGGQDVSTTSGVGNMYLWTKVTDNAGNRATTVKVSGAYTVTANTASENLITLTPSTTGWTNQNITVTVGYGSNISQNRKAGIQGGTLTANATTVTVTANSVVYAEATDIAGNKITKTLQITKIDKTLPTASISPNGGRYTIPTSGSNAAIKAKLTATDSGGSGLNLVQYAWSTSNTTEPTSWTNFTAGGQDVSTTSGVGTRYLWTKVTDKAGNRATTVKVSGAYTVVANTSAENLITLTPSTTNWTNQNITVTVKYGSNISQNRKAGMQGGTLTANATTVTVSANGVVYAEATDIAGNKITKTLQITKIDKTAPTHTKWWWGEVTKDVARLYIQATDSQSGINRVQCPTATATGQNNNWVWFNAVWDAGANAYRADITPATFGHYNQNYLTHLYIYDNAGNGGYYNQSTVKIPANSYELYSNSTQRVPWVMGGYKASVDTTIDYNSNMFMQVYVAPSGDTTRGDGYAYSHTANKIDITNYSKLRIEYSYNFTAPTTSAKLSIGMTTKKINGVLDSTFLNLETVESVDYEEYRSGSGTYELDLAKYKGSNSNSYYVCIKLEDRSFQHSNLQTANINKVELIP